MPTSKLRRTAQEERLGHGLSFHSFIIGPRLAYTNKTNRTKKEAE